MTSKNKAAMGVAIVAGLLLLIEGISGFATWTTIKEFVSDNVTDNEIVMYIFVILIFIASLGGISVIIGGLLIGKNKVRTGKFIIALGAGLGLIGLIVSIIVGLTEGNLTLNTLISLGAIGLILSIVARMMAK
jgi:hypothetical protein